ncbi:cytidine deaminase [Paenibacillus odorifer]|uniref:cytidine deaminase n=1 Tax=Paenibacillus odorifer TaxID=189426 RepID=UPI00096D9ACA|nr:cytidine deaminase [Paenibacillus odorifer]OME19918.1 cytidine deaminase [Paenibacillus odorifer]
MRTYELKHSDYELIEMAMKVLEKNFDDGVYNHTVGGAIRCKNGNVYLGVNCDGIHGSCAEYIAIGAAITAGEREFDTIVATHDKAHNCLVPPCGNCRQMLLNYCPDIKVILNDEEGNPVKVEVKDLLPLSYKRIVVSD